MYEAKNFSPVDRAGAIALRNRLIGDPEFAKQLTAGGIAGAEAQAILDKISRAQIGTPERFVPGKLTDEEQGIR